MLLTLTFDSLPDGKYYATVFGDGATGLAFGKSDTITIMPASPVPHTRTIKAHWQNLNGVSCHVLIIITIQYRVHGAAIWTSVSPPAIQEPVTH